jgi:hypothetical protein
MRPAMGAISPAIVFSNVDLPDPLVPMRHSNAPGARSNDTPSMTEWAPYPTVRSLATTALTMRRARVRGDDGAPPPERDRSR